LQCLLDHRHTFVERLLADDVARMTPKNLPAGPTEPFGKGLVDKAENEVAIVIGRHHRQQVGDRQHRREIEYPAAHCSDERRVGAFGQDRRDFGRRSRVLVRYLSCRPAPLRHKPMIPRKKPDVDSLRFDVRSVKTAAIRDGCMGGMKRAAEGPAFTRDADEGGPPPNRPSLVAARRPSAAWARHRSRMATVTDPSRKLVES